MYIKYFTDRKIKDDTKIIFVGPYTGSWGHLFHFHLPIVNRLREENPDAFIVSAGYIGDDFYYRDSDGNHTIDAYLAYPTNPDIRRVYGVGQGQSDEIKQARDNVEQQFGRIDIDHSNSQGDTEWMHFVQTMKRTHYRLGSFPEADYVEGERYVVLHSKNSKPLQDRDPRGNIIANADYEFDKAFVTALANHIKVYIIGIPNECNTFEGENIIDFTHLSAEERPEVLLPLTNGARAMVSTSSGSTINYALSVGCPSICFACRRYKNNHDTKYNYYGTPTHHHVLMDFDVDKRVTDTLDWLREIEGKPRYIDDIVRIDTDMGKWI